MKDIVWLNAEISDFFLIWADRYLSEDKMETNTSFKFPPQILLHPPLLPQLQPPFFRDSWKQVKVYSWQQALAIKSFHWLISPYSSRTQARQTRTSSPNDQRHSLSGGSNSLCTCGTVTQRHTHTAVPVGHSLSLSLSLSHKHTLMQTLVYHTCGRFPLLVFLSWTTHTQGHIGTHFFTAVPTHTHFL